MHGFELDSNLMLTSGCTFTQIINFYSLQSNITMRNLSIMKVVYDLKQLSYDRQHRYLVLLHRSDLNGASGLLVLGREFFD